VVCDPPEVCVTEKASAPCILTRSRSTTVEMMIMTMVANSILRRSWIKFSDVDEGGDDDDDDNERHGKMGR